jgi:hypothetical protein
MHQHDRTDPEHAYWIEKYLLFHDIRSFISLFEEGGSCSKDLHVVATSQDLIGWTEFLHGKVAVEITAIYRLTRDDWMKAFLSQLL